MKAKARRLNHLGSDFHQCHEGRVFSPNRSTKRGEHLGRLGKKRDTERDRVREKQTETETRKRQRERFEFEFIFGFWAGN